MSIWTFEQAGRRLALAALVAISGCSDILPGATRSRIDVAGGVVTIAGPRGYCVDQGASRSDSDSGVVLMASCAAITGSAAAPRPDVPGVLVASVAAPDGGPPLAQSSDALGVFFRSDAGRAALSQDGQADQVRVLEAAAAGGVFYVHARDSGDGLGEEMRDEYWRALFDVKGRLVTASVFATSTRPFSSQAGRELLGRFVARIRAANV